MIHYNPGKWGVCFAWQLEGSVFPRSCAWALPCSLLSGLLHIVINHGMSEEWAERMHPGPQSATVLSGFTFILGFLVVFRSQQAYSRWWEGGTLLQEIRGEWFNAYSSLLAFCNSNPEMKEEVAAFQQSLVRLVSLLYNCALQQVSTMEVANFELISLNGFDVKSMRFLEQSHDRVEVVLQWIQKLIIEALEKKVIVIAPPILSRVYNQLGNGIVKVNNARKISEFPIPFPYAQMVTTMLIAHWFITLLMCAVLIAEPWMTAIMCFVVVFSFWSINYIGVELEMPFGDDENDLPLHGMMRDLNESLIELLMEGAQIPPKFLFDPVVHVRCDVEETKCFETYLLRLDDVFGQEDAMRKCSTTTATDEDDEDMVAKGTKRKGLMHGTTQRGQPVSRSRDCDPPVPEPGAVCKRVSQCMRTQESRNESVDPRMDALPDQFSVLELPATAASIATCKASLAAEVLLRRADSDALASWEKLAVLAKPAEAPSAHALPDLNSCWQEASTPPQGRALQCTQLLAGDLLAEALLRLIAKIEAHLCQIALNTHDMRFCLSDGGLLDARKYVAPPSSRSELGPPQPPATVAALLSPKGKPSDRKGSG